MTLRTFEPTSEQEAVITCEGSAFVTACPGAGKTRVMVERARRLVANMPVGSGIAFLSFTHAAISELESRLREEAILPSPVFPSFIGTFDSFAWQFLIAPFGINGCEASPRLLADLSEREVTPFVNAHPLPLSCFCPSTEKIIEEAAKARGFDVSQKSIAQIGRYETAAVNLRATLRERGLISFEEARTTALERLESNGIGPRIAAALSARFHEVIVDEAQDCNPGDLKIIAWLRDSGLAVKIVCDPHQAIYAFRGGVTDELVAFREKFEETERRVLTGNFRATPNICKAIAQLRPQRSSNSVDQALGRHKEDDTPVRILSYAGRSVPQSIGTAFANHVVGMGIDLSASPIVAATKASAAAAAGQPRSAKSRHRAVRLAEAVTSFHFAAGFNDMKAALEQGHRILLELEGHLDNCTYRQYLAEKDIEEASWRPQVLAILRSLRFDSAIHADARAWHKAAKDLLKDHLTLGNGASIAQKLPWNAGVSAALVQIPETTAMPRTIHSVKGKEFPAVCVVSVPQTIKSVLDYMIEGKPADRAEEARKLYVAASRAERLLVLAVPNSQAERLAAHLRIQGADVRIDELGV